MRRRPTAYGLGGEDGPPEHSVALETAEGVLEVLEAAAELIIGRSSLGVAVGEIDPPDSRRAFDGEDQGGATASGPGTQQSLLISFGPMIDAMTPFSLKTEAPYGR